MPRPLLLLFKAAISILLLYISLRSVDLAAVGERLSRVNGWWIAVTLVVLTIQVVIQALRWRTIAIQCGAAVSRRAALRINFIAQFFNQVLPSTIGGDAARVWWLARAGSGWRIATYSVLIDRVVGVLALALIVIACLPWTLALLRDPVARATLLLIGCGAVASTCVFMAIGALSSPALDRWAPLRHLAEVSRIFRRLCGSWRTVASVGPVSILIHILTIVAAWCMVQSVSASVSFTLLLFVLPPVVLIATIPVSIAGWGLREGSMIAAFSYAGLAQNDGLVVSVLIGLTGFTIGVGGGLVWIASDARLPKAPADNIRL